MKWIGICLIFLVGVAHGNEVAQITHASGVVSVFRNFEQVYVSKGSRVFRRDLLKIEQGVLELSCGTSQIQAEGPASFQLQRTNQYVAMVLHQGRVLLDCSQGEGWELKYEEFSIKGKGGVLHVMSKDGGLEVARLGGSPIEYELSGKRRGLLNGGEAGRLDVSSNRIQFIRTLSSFEIQVFKDSLVGSVIQAGDMLLDLDGHPFVPLQEMIELESSRRSRLGEDRAMIEKETSIRESSLDGLEREFGKNLEETIDEDAEFSFPTPLPPRPTP